VRADFQVALSRSARTAPQRAERVIATQAARRWQTWSWKEGCRGWLKARFVAIRCWRVDGRGVRRIGWLIGQRPAHGQSGDAKYFWSDFHAHAHLPRMIEYTHWRHWIEQYHEEAKGELGWDQYQDRHWQGLESVLKIRHWQTFDRETSPKSGFFERKTEFQNTLLHRNAVLVMSSYSFLVWLEWRARQKQRMVGRPRRAFSPSP
jgi:hypothetical protein